MTTTKLTALRELAMKHGLNVNYMPRQDGFQVGILGAGNPYCEVVYTSWATRKVTTRSIERADLARQVQAIIEAK